MRRFDVLTLFPEMFRGPFTESVLHRAVERGIITLGVHNIRDWSTDRHRSTDDYPYGGGAGMVMLAGPIADAVAAVRDAARATGVTRSYVILTTPRGRQFSQSIAEDLSLTEHLIVICGHYEGVDERVRDELVDDEISIGDYVLTGGEIPAMVIGDAVARLIPGVVGSDESLAEESISSGLLEYPHFTPPAELHGRRVPDVLLSGNHAQIQKWRRQEALRITFERRPDLLLTAQLTATDAAPLVAQVPLPR